MNASPLPDLRTEIPPIVLLVDPYRDDLAEYSRVLETSGFWVASTVLVDEAVDAAEELKPDVIIADIGGERTRDALEAIAALKAHPELCAVPVIALQPATQAGPSAADVSLKKPVAPPVLLARMR